MSWSVSFAGTPEQVITKLAAQSEAVTGQSKEEYDSALPHLVGLVNQNFGSAGRQISVNAWGSCNTNNGEKVSGFCNVTIKEHDPLI